MHTPDLTSILGDRHQDSLQQMQMQVDGYCKTVPALHNSFVTKGYLSPADPDKRSVTQRQRSFFVLAVLEHQQPKSSAHLPVVMLTRQFTL